MTSPSPSNSTIEPVLPDRIRMSGLRFMLQGWNNEFTKTDETSDGFPVYRMPSYTLYGVIDIIGVRIKRVQGR